MVGVLSPSAVPFVGFAVAAQNLKSQPPALVFARCSRRQDLLFPTAKQSGFWSRAKGAHDSRFDFPLDVLLLSAEAVFVLSSRSCSWAALRTSGGGQWQVCFSLQTSSLRRLLFCSMSSCASAFVFELCVD
jgi:hypothetical protein